MFGTKELGLEVKWEVEFFPHGKTLAPSPFRIYADVGNQCCEGITDNHAAKEHLSSTDIIVKEPNLVINHLLREINACQLAGTIDKNQPIKLKFCTHWIPDWDACACFHLCQHLVEHAALPPYAEDLAEASNHVDQSTIAIEGLNPGSGDSHKVQPPRVRRVSFTSAVIVYYSLMAEKHGENLLREGDQLIGHYARHNIKPSKGNLFLDVDAGMKDVLCQEWKDSGKKLEDVWKNLEDDHENFVKEREENCEVKELSLPQAGNDGQLRSTQTKLFCFKDKPRSPLFKFWVRSQFDKEGVPLYGAMFVPGYKEEGREPGVKEKIMHPIISTDPSSGFLLHRLGYALEENEKLIRGENDTRKGQPRPGVKYATNSDPWYDGHDKDFTLVAGPTTGKGTCLSDEQIVDVVCSDFHKIKASQIKLWIFYFLDLDNEKYTETQSHANPDEPLGCVDQALKFIKEIQLETFLFPKQTAKLYLDRSTEHGVLMMEVSHPGLKEGTSLDELAGNLAGIKESMQTRMKEILGENKWIKAETWGLEEGFWMMEIQDPDLDFHDRQLIQATFEKLCNRSLDDQELDSLINDRKGSEFLESAGAVCVFRGHEDKTAEWQRMTILYGLFLKTAYRKLSEKLKPILEMVDDPRFAADEAVEKILRLQKTYSGFLAEKDFSDREISLNEDVQKFFGRHSGKISLRPQKKETEEEMNRLRDLAESLHNRTREAQDRKLNGILVIVGIFSILSVGDFLYTWSHDSLMESSVTLPPVWNGTIVFGTLLAIGLLCWGVVKRRIKRRK